MFKYLKRGSRRAAIQRLFRRARGPETQSPEPPGVDLNYTNWNGLKRLINVLNGSTPTFEPLSSAVGRLSTCAEIFDIHARTHQDYAKLGTDMDDLLHIIAQRFGGTAAQSITRESIANLAHNIDEEIKSVLKYHEDSGPEGDAGTTRDMDEVLKCCRRVLTHLALFSMSENTTIWKAGDKEVADTLLELLPHSPEAHYRGSDTEDARRTGCIPNTGVAVLQEIRDWIYYGKFQNTFWLNGTAGTGKTTIAYSLCEYLENSGKPSASFFCSRHISACRDVNRIIPSLSFQLAQLSRPFRCAISGVLQRDSEVHKKPIGEQFEELIAVPLRNVGHTFGVDVVLVIDALEECEDKDGVNQVLEALFKRSSDLNLKLLVASRPNPGILYYMRANRGGHQRSELRLHDGINRMIAQEDIKTYLTTKLGCLGLSPVDLESLAQRSGRLFAYASSIVDYIQQDNSSGGAEQAKRLLAIPSSSGVNSSQDTETQYGAMIKETLDNSGLDDSKKAEIMHVLRTVTCMREPLTVNAIAGLLGLDFSSLIRNTLRSLLPVLHAAESTGLEIIMAESFVKYLLDPHNSDKLHGDARQTNTLLAQSCFQLIEMVNPPFNICNLDSSYLLDREVPYLDERVNEAIPQELLYAGRHWRAHLELAERYNDLEAPLHDFLSRRLLLWMEIMNLKRCLCEGIELLHSMYAWLQETEYSVIVQNFVYDAWMFMIAFSSNAVSHSTPHIYVSALQFWPDHRPISLSYGPMLRGLVKGAGGILQRRERAPITIFTMGQRVTSLAHSPQGSYIIAGNEANEICTLDIRTGATIQKLQGHTGSVTAAAYSSDGAYIVSGSDDRTIRIWDAHTGKPVGQPLRGHTDSVSSVAYSLDGAYIVSGSHD